MTASLLLALGIPAHADAPIERLDSPHRLPNRFIVELHEGTVLSWDTLPKGNVNVEEIRAAQGRNKQRLTSVSMDLARKYRGAISKVYGSALKGFALHITESDARRLAKDARVRAIYADEETWSTATVGYLALWHLDRIDERVWPLDGFYHREKTGHELFINPQHLAKLFVWVLDSGLRTTHQEFSDFGGSGIRASLFDDTVGSGRDPSNDTNNDCNGHGTQVAALIVGRLRGVAKGAKVSSIRVMSCDSLGQAVGSIQDLVDGINRLTEFAEIHGVNGSSVPYREEGNKLVLYHQPSVANISLQGGKNDALRTAIMSGIRAGVTFVTGAGNKDKNACDFYPSGIPEVITVGATQKVKRPFKPTHDEIWTDLSTGDASNYGACVDIFAPGADVSSADYTSDSAFVSGNGTSLAAPLVAGVAALYLTANPTASPAQVQQAIIDASTRGEIQGDLKGSPNRLLYSGVPGNSVPFDNTTPQTQPPEGFTAQEAAILQSIMSVLFE